MYPFYLDINWHWELEKVASEVRMRATLMNKLQSTYKESAALFCQGIMGGLAILLHTSVSHHSALQLSQMNVITI